ncbi:MAG: HAD family hydrolase [Verrucomicrobiales bacterium]|nr:HAD hydrolase family protein [Verrucomicrobiota bacterium JB025]
MKPLPPVVEPSVILSFDFDGTLHDPDRVPPVPVEVFEALGELREKRGAVWGINTGRSMAQMTEGFLESRFPFLPDWVVAREREVFFPNDFGRWLPHRKWNKRCEKEIHRLFKRSKKLLKAVRHEVEEHTGAQWLEMEGEPAGMISRTEEEMEWIVGHIGPMVAEVAELSWQRNSIYLRFGHRDFQKGSSLSEVARWFGVGAAGCFAIGDSHNDVEMLDPAHAGMIACPGNAVAEIREVVAARGGYVAERAHGAGALEALEHHFG